MGRSSEFIIENNCSSKFSIWVEPEAFPISIFPGEAIVVHDEFKQAPVTVRIGKDVAGSTVLSIWPGDGNTVVMKNGKDVLEPPYDE